VPALCDEVIILNTTTYPELSADVNVGDIHFAFGSKIGSINHLIYDKAHVQLDWTQAGMKDRWHMLSLPIKGVVSGDLAFGGKPSVYLRKFDVAGTSSGSFIPGTWTEYYNSNTIGFAPGEGFIIWVKNTNTDNLNGISGILELPCFTNTITGNINKANPFHSYDPSTQTSTFEFFDYTEGQPVGLGTYETKDHRTDEAYQINTGNFAQNYAFAGDFALVGNPYLGSLRFSTLVSGVSEVNPNQYKIFNGTTFQTFESSEADYIAPWQSFIIEKSTSSSATDFTLNFTAANTLATDAVLRATSESDNRLEIIASNGTDEIRTIVALKETGDATALTDWDSRKLRLGISNVPEIYTVKETLSGKVGLDIHTVNTVAIEIPLAIATAYEGNMSFTFNGIDDYDAYITLIDREADTPEILLEGSSFTHSFNYVPKKVNNQTVADEDRFVLKFAKAPTALEQVPASRISVYSRNNTLYASSGSSALIRAIYVYNTQGRLMYADDKVNAALYTVNENNLPEIGIVKLITDNEVKTIKIVKK